MDYKALLKRAHEHLPESVLEKERFEIPKVVGHLEGNKTIIRNFGKIAQALERDPQHLLKFVLKELAAPGVFRGTSLTIGTKVSAARVNDKIKQYAEQFVLCSVCGKPDTQLVKEGEFTNMKCMACGHKQSVKSII